MEGNLETLGQAVRDHGRFRRARDRGIGRGKQQKESERVAAVQSWVKGREEGRALGV
jgi:hypothetical protein